LDRFLLKKTSLVSYGKGDECGGEIWKSILILSAAKTDMGKKQKTKASPKHLFMGTLLYV